MAAIVLGKSWWHGALAGILLLGFGANQASAGPNEDYDAGMVAYKRSDFTSAMPLLRKAADAGHAQAQADLASILDIADQDEEAVAYYRKAVAAGNLDGMYGLGTMLVVGEGVKKDVREARSLFERAATGGHKAAIVTIAEAYIRGALEIPEEQRKGQDALRWITLAADDGNQLALDTLEKAYRNGDYGLVADVQKADALKKKLAAVLGAKEKKEKERGRRRGDAR